MSLSLALALAKKPQCPDRSAEVRSELSSLIADLEEVEDALDDGSTGPALRVEVALRDLARAVERLRIFARKLESDLIP